MSPAPAAVVVIGDLVGSRTVADRTGLHRRLDDPMYGPGMTVPAGLEAVVRRVLLTVAQRRSNYLAARMAGCFPTAPPGRIGANGAVFGPCN